MLVKIHLLVFEFWFQIFMREAEISYVFVSLAAKSAHALSSVSSVFNFKPFLTRYSGNRVVNPLIALQKGKIVMLFSLYYFYFAY